MSLSISLPAIPNGSFPFSLPIGLVQRGFPVPSVIHISPPLWYAYYGISSHLLLFFVDILKPITSKRTKSGSLFVSKTTENHIKMQMSKLGHLSPITLPSFFQ